MSNEKEEVYTSMHLWLGDLIYVIDEKPMPEVAEPLPLLKKAVEPPPPLQVATPVVQPVTPPVTSARTNPNQVLILFNNQQSPYLKPQEEALLIKILHSIRLTIDDVELINFNNIKRIDYVDLLKEKVLHKLISFGISLRELELHIDLTAYEVKKVEGIDMLLADSLAELERNVDKKKMLWKALQQMFVK